MLKRHSLVYAALPMLAFILLIYEWFFSGASWLHPELLGTAVYVLNNPDEAFLQTIRKVFDWMAFDPNVNRVRPLNDVFEVIDAMFRPHLAVIFGPHPSAMPSSVLTILLVPILFYNWLRRATRNQYIAIITCAILISTTGILSVIIGYIRPAKKLNIVFLCLSLYMAERYKNDQSARSLSGLYFALLASFFSDEAGLANFFIIGIFYWNILFVHVRNIAGLVYLSLPLLFIILTKFVLPAIYAKWSVHGAWDALADNKKFTIFYYLGDPAFIMASFESLARSLMSTFAIATHTYVTEIITIILFTALPIVHILQNKILSIEKIFKDKFVLTTIIVAITSGYVTLLDWYPFPYEVSYLGSFNYYYHSVMIIPILMWFAMGIISFSKYFQLARYSFVALVALFMVSANFMMFHKVNLLAQIIHIYPYSNNILWKSLANAVQEKKYNQLINVTAIADAETESKRYEVALRNLFGSRWNKNGFYDTLVSIAPTPIMSKNHVEHFFHSTIHDMPINVHGS